MSPDDRAAAVEAEIAMLVKATAKTAWREAGNTNDYDRMSEASRAIMEGCVARGIRIGMTWG